MEDEDQKVDAREKNAQTKSTGDAPKRPPHPPKQKLPTAKTLPSDAEGPDRQTASVARHAGATQGSPTATGLPEGIAVPDGKGGVNVRCPSCPAKLKFDPQKAGHAGKCGKCKNQFRFPTNSQAAAAGQQPTQKAGFDPDVAGVVPCPKCGRGIQYHPKIQGKGFNCPHCGRGVRFGLPKYLRKATASFKLGLLSLFLTILTGLPAIVLGAFALRDIKRGKGRAGGQGFAIAGITLGCLGSLMLLAHLFITVPAIFAGVEAGRQAESRNNLKQIGLAMHNHHDTHGGELPPAFSVDSNGNPLLSWRVHILPFIEQGNLYDKFKLDESWDSPHNKKLIDQMPDLYRSPGADTGEVETVYLAVVGQDGPGSETAFRKDGEGRTFADFRDGSASTILVVEANEDQAVVWTKPADWEFAPEEPRRGLGELRQIHFDERGRFVKESAFTALFADGSVRMVSNSEDDQTVRRHFCRNDSELLGIPSDAQKPWSSPRVKSTKPRDNKPRFRG